jgi:hypothetical protein
MSAKAYIDTEIVLLSKDEGGRSTPILPIAYGGGYRPHIVLQPRNTREPKIEMRDGMRCCEDPFISVAFWSGDAPIPIGSPFKTTLFLSYYPHEMYRGCVPGASFTLREGSKIIGNGEIIGFRLEESEKITA